VSQVLRLEVLAGDSVSIETDRLGRKTGYRFDGKPYKLHQIEHINRFPVAGSAYGQGPIQKAQRFLRGVLDLQDYADNWFKKGGIPNGYLKTDQTLTPELADQYRKRWMEQQEQRGYGPQILGNGLSWVQNYLNPKDAMFLENQDHNDRVIATMFGVPAYKVHAAVEGTNLTYQNIQDANRDYINDTLMKYLNKIEAALTRLTPRGQEIRFKAEDLLRADFKTQVDTYKALKEAELVSDDTATDRLGLPPLTKEEQPDLGSTPETE
jgi:HK97 family phage portal protein